MTTLRNRYKKLSLTLGLVGILAASIAVPVSAADNEVIQQINGGSLSQSIGEVTFTPVAYSNDGMDPSVSTMTLSVNDETGTRAGWTINVQASDFAYSGSAPTGAAIPVENFEITGSGAFNHVGGQAQDGENGPAVSDSAVGAFVDGSARAVFEANVGYGGGEYTQVYDIELNIPDASAAGTYTSTLTVTAAAAPDAA